MNKIAVKTNHLLHRSYCDRYPAEASEYLERLPAETLRDVLLELPLDTAVRIWERLSPVSAAQVLTGLADNDAKPVLDQIDPGRGVALLRALADGDRRRLLALAAAPARQDLEHALSYAPDSAAATMGTRLHYYTPPMTVRETLLILKQQRRPTVRVLFLVNEDRVLTAQVDIQHIALAHRDALLGDLSRPVRAFVEATASREEMAEIFERHRVTELPVVDAQRRLIGIVRHHTLINVAMEETSADIQTMVGVSKDERALSKISFAVRKRQPWLQINLLTAFLAAAVVGLFEQTIAQVTALAVLLPVVAGQSGNTGAQALAVTMRGLALREVWPRQWFKLIRKEAGTGFWNGLAIALTTALGVYLWSRSFGLCLIIGSSMILSMMIASMSGAMIPVLLTKLGQDPAAASSIFLTTVTDVMGFFSFLGIATLLIGML
jgi:magnesium transporter